VNLCNLRVIKIIKRNGVPLEEMTKNIAISGEVPFDLHALYVDIMQFVNFVEEERRLLYVGITRSKKACLLTFRVILIHYYSNLIYLNRGR
jgi:Superfamily I DNA and RNA helicases